MQQASLSSGKIAQSIASWRLTAAVGCEMIEEEWVVADAAHP
jgi:hypothetical protein